MINLKNIINEEIKKALINESLTSEVYHFCTLESLYGIAKNNAFILTSSKTNDSDKRMSYANNRVYPYYMCFSRTFSPDVGYAKQRLNSTSSWKQCLVRIQINGNKLNYLYKSQPVNYFIDDNDSKIVPYKGEINNDVNQKEISRLQMHEYEDRLLSTNSYIPNADKYIDRIDILINKNILSNKGKNGPRRNALLYSILNSGNVSKDKIVIYTNPKEFRVRSINGIMPIDALNGKINKGQVEFNKTTDLSLPNALLKPLMAVVSLLCYGETNNLSKLTKFLAKKYGFGKYYKELLKLIPSNIVKNEDDMLSRLKFWGISKTNYNGIYRLYEILIEEMINDFMKANNFNDYKDILRLKRTIYKLKNKLPLGKIYKPYYESVLKSHENFNKFINLNNDNVEKYKQFIN